MQNFNRDDSKTLFNHFLLHVTRFRGLGVKTKTEAEFKHNDCARNLINNYSVEPT